MPDASSIALLFSAAALAVSIITMWVTLFRHGVLKMTQPTTVMLGPDGPHHEGNPKIYLRTLLYSNSKRGQVIENMFVRLSRGEQTQNFSIWVLGEDRLSRGSGIFISDQGVVANHHFLLPPDAEKYVFKAGEYRLEVFARLVGKKAAESLWSDSFVISGEESKMLAQRNNAIYFDWGPDSDCYISKVRSKPPSPWPDGIMEKIGGGASIHGLPKEGAQE